MENVCEEQPQDTSRTFEDQNETPIQEIYDNEPLETKFPVGPVIRSKTRKTYR